MKKKVVKTEFRHKLIWERRCRHNNRAAIFLDRDGVIIDDVHYISDASMVRVKRGAREALELISAREVPIFIVTNQSGIGRGYYSWKEYEEVTSEMLLQLGDRVKVWGIYACGDKPLKGTEWRKPKIGMIVEAVKDFRVEPRLSVLVGDRVSDMEAGLRANVKGLTYVVNDNDSKVEEEEFEVIVQKAKIRNCELQVVKNSLEEAIPMITRLLEAKGEKRKELDGRSS